MRNYFDIKSKISFKRLPSSRSCQISKFCSISPSILYVGNFCVGHFSSDSMSSFNNNRKNSRFDENSNVQPSSCHSPFNSIVRQLLYTRRVIEHKQVTNFFFEVANVKRISEPDRPSPPIRNLKKGQNYFKKMY